MGDFIICYYKEIIALTGGLSSLVTVLFVSYSKVKDTKLKEKELSLKITEDTQKKLFSKKIETYQELYHLYILYSNEDYQIGRLTEYFERNEDGHVVYQEYRDVEEYEVKMKILEEIFETIKKNVFYISDELIDLYNALYVKYNKSLDSHHNNHIQRYYSQYTRDEEYDDLNKAKKLFYESNKINIVNMILVIKSDLMQLKKSINL